MENNLDRDEKTENHYELMRNLEMDVSYFHCYWEDSQGIYTEEELKAFFEEVGQGYEFDPNSTQENSDCIGWVIYHYDTELIQSPNEKNKLSDIVERMLINNHFESLYWVIKALNQMENIKAHAVCHNMTIRRIL
tara:strand:+ start:1107 stop:1511 length:405 start_codon:yes stop_codon:yes gene_type:complete